MERGSIAHEWIPQDIRTQNKIMRTIYLTDGVAGAALDFYREIPFGPMILSGMEESKLRLLNDALDAISINRHLPFLSGDLLTVGRLITHMIMDESRGYWTDLIVHDSDWISVEFQPILGEEPMIDLITPPEYRRWALSRDPRAIKARKKLDPRLVRMLAAGSTIPLSSENTLFIPRRASANDVIGTGLPFRILPLVAIEYAYLDAEISGMRRRAAPILYATVGIEGQWEPAPDELAAVQDLLVATEEDPAGAKMAIRNGIELNTVSGYTDIAKYGEQWQWLREAKLQGLGMNEAFATGESSWCLPGYSLVSTSKGLVQIKDVPNWVGLSTREAKRIGTISLKGSGLRLTTGEGEHAASAWAYSGKKLVKRVTTDAGYSLDGTDEHPVLVLRSNLDLEWVQIKNLRKGDVVALRQGGLWPTEPLDLTAARDHAYEAPHITYRHHHARNLQYPKLPAVLSRELASVLGYLVSEGDCTDRDRVIFGNVDEDVLAHYHQCHKRVFPDQHLSYSTVDGSSGVPFTSVTTCSWVVREFLSQIGVGLVYSDRKEVPWSVLRSPKSHVAAFLSALFEGDGSPYFGIEYTSYSKKLASQVQQLLLRFNIISKLEPTIKEGGWRVRISGRENIQTFINEIGFVSSTKREAVAEHLEVKRGRERRRWKHLGAIVQQHVSSVLNERKKGTRYLNSQGETVCATVRGWRINRVSPTSNKARYLLRELKKIDSSLSHKIKRLWRLPCVWVEVSRIKKLGIKPVYDLCVPEHESYVANGFVVHNSYLESMLSLGMERIRNFRDFITEEVILRGILEPLCKLHGYYKRSRAEIDHRIRTSGRDDDVDLELPRIEWQRSLKPSADRDYLDILNQMEEKGVPITIRQWAQAGGFDLDNALENLDNDIELRKQIKSEWTDAKKKIQPEEEEESRFGSARIAAAVAELPVWKEGEFGRLRRGEVAEVIGKTKGRWGTMTKKAWKRVENQLVHRHNMDYRKVRQFQYLLARAGVLKFPLPAHSIVEVRDVLLERANGTPNRALMKEIYWLNSQLSKRASDKSIDVESIVKHYNGTQTGHTAPWIRPAGKNLLTGVRS